MHWRDLQERTADLFRQLGCTTSVDCTVAGARAAHAIDVLVEFKSFGVPTKWVIECKHWRRNVSKEKVMALKSISDDIGADRAIIVSSSGFQAGAIRCTSNTNITLTDLEGLQEITSHHLASLSLLGLEARGYRTKHGLNTLYASKKEDASHWSSKPIHQSVDGRAVFRCLGELSLLQYGFERARLETPPYSYAWTDDGNSVLQTRDLQEFINRASEVISSAESLLKRQREAIQSDV